MNRFMQEMQKMTLKKRVAILLKFKEREVLHNQTYPGIIKCSEILNILLYRNQMSFKTSYEHSGSRSNRITGSFIKTDVKF